LSATSQKVPTLCSYKDKRLRWGYQTDLSSYPGTQRHLIRGVKLLLDESQQFRYGPAVDSKGVIKDLNMTPIEVAGDYLKKLVTHGNEILTRRFGSAMETMDLQYILTVPAVWSDKGKDATMQAAHLAGIPHSSLTLLSEPEAAAVYAIRTIQPNSIAVRNLLNLEYWFRFLISHRRMTASLSVMLGVEQS
jgi:molecular chaperone DnaK (HSP70)